ncbi:MAG: IS30 family transposase [Neisseriaceae bacterium]
MAKHLTQRERYYICRQIANFVSIASIAESLEIHKSTVYREIKRNSRELNDYDSDYAQKQSSIIRSNASRSKCFKQFTDSVITYIKDKLNLKWSPEQISGRLKIDMNKSISHVTIYKYIKHDKANAGKLFKLLSHQGRKYRYGTTNTSNIIGRIDISQRPKIVDKKTRIGDFEVDTIVTKRNSGTTCLFTMVDRRSKLTFIRKVENRYSLSIKEVIEDIYLNTTIPIRTMTSDNGPEFAEHKAISQNISCGFYFARPYRSCDRALNENTNGLIRKFIPKGSDLATITEDEIRNIENLLNNRPRKSLKFRTPNEVINKYLQRISKNHILRQQASFCVSSQGEQVLK